MQTARPPRPVARPPGGYDFVHLSNILDWLSPADAQALLDLAHAALRPGGRMVVNVATLEMLSAAYAALKGAAGTVQVLLVNVARGVEQLETLRFEAVNPTFLLHVGKPAS